MFVFRTCMIVNGKIVLTWQQTTLYCVTQYVPRLEHWLFLYIFQRPLTRNKHNRSVQRCRLANRTKNLWWNNLGTVITWVGNSPWLNGNLEMRTSWLRWKWMKNSKLPLPTFLENYDNVSSQSLLNQIWVTFKDPSQPPPFFDAIKIIDIASWSEIFLLFGHLCSWKSVSQWFPFIRNAPNEI